MLTNFIASEASDQDYVQVHFDALRLDYNRRADELIAELNWTDSTAFQSWSSSTGNGDSLLFATDELGHRYLRYVVNSGSNSDDLHSFSSGRYFLEWEDRVPIQMADKEPRIYTNNNGNNSQYQVHQHYDSYNVYEGQPYTEWRKHTVILDIQVQTMSSACGLTTTTATQEEIWNRLEELQAAQGQPRSTGEPGKS